MSYWRAVCRKTGKHGSGGDARKRPAMNLAGRLPYIRWADARVQRDPRLSVGAARAASWGILKRKYNLSKYEDLPIGKYAECVAYIKQACYESTGVELDLPEQTELGLEP